MSLRKKFWSIFGLSLAFLLFTILPVFAQEPLYPEKPEGYVTDQAKMLGDTADLEEMLSNFEKETSNEIAVVTIESLEGISIEEYAVELFQKWGVGKKGLDNGVLLVVSRDDREVRIETGYGLEGALPDGVAKIIIANEITPAFKEGDYHDGVKKGLESIMAATKGEYVPEPQEEEGGFASGIIGFIVFFAVFTIIIVIGIFSNRKKNRSGKKGGGAGTYTSTSDDDSGSFWGGSSSSGGFSSGGGSSSGFGGFGGGSSGGGGASGKW